jgi:hypothetical protein
MSATTVDLSSDFSAGKYTSTEVSVDTNKRITIPVTWTDLDGYPELVVEMLPDGTVSPSEKNYFPVKLPDEVGFLRPIKLRMGKEDGEELIVIESLYGTSPYVRIVVYANEATSGSISFELDAG